MEPPCQTVLVWGLMYRFSPVMQVMMVVSGSIGNWGLRELFGLAWEDKHRPPYFIAWEGLMAWCSPPRKALSLSITGLWEQGMSSRPRKPVLNGEQVVPGFIDHQCSWPWVQGQRGYIWV